MNNHSEIAKIKDLAIKVRKNILTMSLAAGASSSHFGGSLSTVEILATLYDNVLNFKASEPLWEDRDRFILSKGHACLGFYSVLCEKGYFKKEDLNLFGIPIISTNQSKTCVSTSVQEGLVSQSIPTVPRPAMPMRRGAFLPKGELRS